MIDHIADHGDEFGLSKDDLERTWSLCYEIGIIHSSEINVEME